MDNIQYEYESQIFYKIQKWPVNLSYHETLRNIENPPWFETQGHYVRINNGTMLSTTI